jgi:1,4-dihydroxy-6-naphthoate synthase
VSLTLAYSPCPNDTYVFAALANGLLDGGPEVNVRLADIDELNAAAARAEFELIKVSYGAIPYLSNRYRILRAGGALGRGCGPLLVARPAASPELFADFARRRIAIPGERTTAFLLLQLALGRRPHTTTLRFDKIVAEVANGHIDAGLIIHESRFTYRDKGLIAIADLGEWWETLTLLPIPLGAILVRDDISDDAARSLDDAIRASLAFARAHDEQVMPYVAQHSAEMSPEVMRAHIALYVNEFTEDVGKIGIEAAHALFARAREAGILRAAVEPRFV